MWGSGPPGWFRIEIWKQVAVSWTRLYSRTDVYFIQTNVNTVPQRKLNIGHICNNPSTKILNIDCTRKNCHILGECTLGDLDRYKETHLYLRFNSYEHNNETGFKGWALLNIY
jgi:hypothetical protein